MMKRTILALAVLTLFPGAASAGAAQDWSGFYVGADVGMANIHDKSTIPNINPYCWWDCESYTQSGNGFVAGAHAGYNWQDDALVYGLEADIAGAGASDTLNNFCSTTYCDYTQKVTLEGLSTVRARLGYDLGGVLPFVTGGFALGLVRNYVADNNDEGLWDATNFRAGYTLGGGVEYPLDPNLSVRVEGSYYDLGSKTIISKSILARDQATLPVKFSDNGFIVRAGFSYNFGH